MKKEDILKIIRDAWDDEVYSISFESVLGQESYIEGKKEFFEKISKDLDKLFDDNDLSK